jgi:hypothetical protein
MMILKLNNNNRFISTNMITAAFIKIETLFLPHLKKLNNFLCLFLKVTSENDFFTFKKICRILRASSSYFTIKNDFKPICACSRPLERFDINLMIKEKNV